MNMDRLRSDLADLAEEVAPVDLRDRTLRTSRRIGVQRTLASSAAALVMIGAATGTAFAFFPRGDVGPAPAATTPPAVVTPTPTPMPSVTVTEPVNLAPLTVSEIENGSLTLPDWGTDVCPTGTFRFAKGNHVYLPQPDSPMAFAILGEPVPVDVDGDGVNEMAAEIVCSPHAVTAQQVLVFKRAADGGVQTLGRVTSVRPPARGALPQELIQSVAAGDAGTVRVQWADQQPFSPADPQWRGYRWVDGQFKQVSGPTRFPTVDADVRAQAQPVELKLLNGAYVGELKVTVHNNGPMSAQSLGLRLTLPAGVTMANQRGGTIGECGFHDQGPPAVLLCGLATLAPNKSVTVTFTLSYAGPATNLTGSIAAETVQDTKNANDKVDFNIKVVR
ncbi:hypothetical protein [Micromonospora sp. NPDC004704]